MSTPFYDLASLVVVPSGYKASKVYAQKPLTTDGQLTFSRASTATRVNSAGLIETVSSNVPRLDYQGSTCPKLLLEPQRQNLVLHSSAFDNGVWDNNGGGVLVTANNTIAPDGTQSADKIENNPGSINAPWMLQFFSSLSGGQNYVYSIYAKAATAGTKRLGIWNNSTSWSYQNISVTTEWKRFQFPFVANASATQWGVGMQFNTGETEYFVWGAQLELGAYSTSLIPTTTATVTRLADACSKTGISSLIGQTEGVIFLDWIYTEQDSAGIIPITLSAGTGPNAAYIIIEANSQITFDFIVAGVATGRIRTSTGYAVKGTRYKMAFAYKANDFAAYINGQLIGTDNSGAITGLSQLNFSYPYASGYSFPNTINQALLFKTRLTNAQLAELTSL